MEHRSIRVKMGDMATRTQRTERRTDALSKERIVDAAIEILDADGEDALTFRVLAARLATGAGAIYHHVANKDDLLATAANDVVGKVMADLVRSDSGPRDAIRAAALGIFDAIDVHPWVGTQLARAPWQPAIPQILEALGGPLQALGVPEHAQFDSASALMSYVLGAAGQNAANARIHVHETDRTAFLGKVAAQWTQLDPAEYPFVHRVAATQLPHHDDRAQFLAGIDFILAGIEAH
jgi:AcrR family transcriptional regulator